MDRSAVPPSDPAALRQGARKIRRHIGSKAPLVYPDTPADFAFGRAHRLRDGGGVTIIANVARRRQPAPMEFVGLDDTYAESGDPAALLRKYGLTAGHIEAAARRVVERRGAGYSA